MVATDHVKNWLGWRFEFELESTKECDNMETYTKPLPITTPETKEFWEGCKRGELLIQRCKDCGTYRFFPIPMCYNCNSFNSEWAKVSGKGKIHSWVVVTHNIHPAFANDIPYAVVSVQLDEQENVRLLGNIVDCRPEEIKPNMPVEVFFDKVTDEFTLPKWKPIR